ncbi:MAG: hypothetical protein A2X99_05495 [Deltaproteobacteria bacterium GWB2_55_19]|nr:MAG: hypothetical protein A2X99_05495 [Deltaproteobacteria bacterium GWB2_55_19]HAO93566.1 hypothetical protein [Deltaproteobacteria bacterium]
MKIGLITTLNTNIGDDFIREGIRHLLGDAFKGKKVEFIPINKHNPFSVYPAWHPARLAHRFSGVPLAGRLLGKHAERLASTLGRSFFDDCGLIVQCGAPVVWPDCHKSEWAGPLWTQVIGRLFNRVPVLNLAAGSCYPWEKQPDRLDNRGDLKFIKEILGYCRLTTSRDRLVQRLFASAGSDTQFIPCSAFLAARNKAEKGDLILINYMKGAGHYDWAQSVDADKWEKTVIGLINRLGGRHKLAFICHNEAEMEEAKTLAPDLPRLFPKSIEEYFSVTANAKGALCNRMHASVGMAGQGIPSIAVGTDTRLLMVKALGLNAFYVKDADIDMLEQNLETMLSLGNSEKERLLSLRAETRKRYLEAIKGAL